MPVDPSHPCDPRAHLLLADDSPILREGLARLVDDECDLVVVGSATTCEEVRELVGRQPARVLVTELNLGGADGIALIKEVRELAPELHILVFTNQPEQIYAARCLQAGVRGYLSKRSTVTTLFRAIREIASGGMVVPAGVTLGAPAGGSAPANGMAARLTNRELQVFRLAGLALPTREIAGKLGVSVKTVESHRENIKNKLDLDSHAELVACAAQWLRENGGS